MAPLEVGLGVIGNRARRERKFTARLDLAAFLGKLEAMGEIFLRNGTFHTADKLVSLKYVNMVWSSPRRTQLTCKRGEETP